MRSRTTGRSSGDARDSPAGDGGAGIIREHFSFEDRELQGIMPKCFRGSWHEPAFQPTPCLPGECPGVLEAVPEVSRPIAMKPTEPAVALSPLGGTDCPAGEREWTGPGAACPMNGDPLEWIGVIVIGVFDQLVAAPPGVEIVEPLDLRRRGVGREKVGEESLIGIEGT
jgi:hypothetical protein